MTAGVIISPFAIMIVITLEIILYKVFSKDTYLGVQETIGYLGIGAIAAICYWVRLLLTQSPTLSLVTCLLSEILLSVQAVYASGQLRVLQNLLEIRFLWRLPYIWTNNILPILSFSFLLTVGLLHWSFYTVFGGILLGLTLLIYLVTTGKLVRQIHQPELRLNFVRLSVIAFVNGSLSILLLRS